MKIKFYKTLLTAMLLSIYGCSTTPDNSSITITPETQERNRKMITDNIEKILIPNFEEKYQEINKCYSGTHDNSISIQINTKENTIHQRAFLIDTKVFLIPHTLTPEDTLYIIYEDKKKLVKDIIYTRNGFTLFINKNYKNYYNKVISQPKLVENEYIFSRQRTKSPSSFTKEQGSIKPVIGVLLGNITIPESSASVITALRNDGVMSGEIYNLECKLIGFSLFYHTKPIVLIEPKTKEKYVYIQSFMMDLLGVGKYFKDRVGFWPNLIQR